MDDLISRKAVIKEIYTIKEEIEENALYSGADSSASYEVEGLYDAHLVVENAPTVPAAPLDKLCEWLSEHSVIIPCETCSHLSCGHCMAIGDMDKPCPNKAEDWQRAIKEWMEGLDAAD